MSKGRRALMLAGGAFAGLVLLLALAFALVQTPPGRNLLAAALGRALADPGERITITGLAGFIPFDMTVARIEIADAQGPHLVVTQAALAIAPADLLSGRLTLRRLSAREVDLLRPAASSGHSDPLALLHPPLAIRLEQGEIERLVIGAAFAGEPAAATLRASGTLGGGEAAADLDLHRIDATPGNAKLHLALSGTPPRLTLEGDIEEPSGRLLASLTGQTQLLPLAVHVAGEGPLADWHGSLAARAGAAATLDAAFAIAGERLTATGSAQLAGVLPPALGKLLGQQTTFAVAAQIAGNTIRLDELSLATPDAKLGARGAFDRSTQALSGDGEVALADLADVAPLLGVAASGKASAALTLGGTLRAPAARLTLAGEQLALDQNAVAAAHATIDLHVAGDALDAASPIDISASGDAAGVTLAGASLPGGLGERLDWRLAGRFDRALQQIALHELSVSDGGARVVAQAGGNAGSIAGNMMLTLPDIAMLAGAERHGGLALAGDFHAEASGSVVAVVHGTLSAPQSGTAMLDRLLGAKTEIGATLRRGPDGTLSASEVSVDGAAVTLAATAERAADGRLSADYRLALPRLAALAPEVTGSATVTGTASGPPDALHVNATLSADGLSAGTARLDHVEVLFDLPDLARRAAHLDAKFRGAGLDGTASADARLDADTLHLGQIRLAAATTRVDGDLTLRLDRFALDGTLNASAPDLKPWSTLAGTPLGGSAELKARLAAGKGQAIELHLDGKALRLGTASVQQLQATATLADVLAQPTGRAELRIDTAAAGPASLASLRLGGAFTRPGHFALSGEAHGRIVEDFTLGLGADAAIDARGAELRLTRLDGTLGKVALSLHQPLLLTRRDAALGFADLDLGFGSGRITGAGSLGATALALHLQAQDLPVHSLAEFGGQTDMGGVLGFEATLSGTRAQPEGSLVIDGEQLRLAAASRPDLAPVGLVASAEWRRGELRVKGRVAGPQNTALGFTGSAPLTLEPQGLGVHLPPQGALALRLEGDGELANLADLMPLGEDRLAGHLTIDVSVGGTVAAPAASGRLTLRDGRYESLFWGTALQGVSFDLVGDRDRLVLQNFHAGDGAKGTLALSGALNLAAADGPAFNFAGKFQSFRAVQRDEATATVSGDVSFAGDIAAPRLGAKLRIDQAELQVPERLPQNLQPIPVTLIDSATGQVLSTPEQSRASVALLSLALAVDVDMPGQVFVRGRGLDSEWRGKLSITGTTAQPVITGTLDVVRGTYDFLGKSAVLNRGAINFLGGSRIDPDINIEAQASSTDVVAIIDITGTATKPTIKLSSQPALPQDEILSRVLFGTSVSQISAAQGIAIAQAAAQLASGGGPGVIDRVRQTLGLDRLSFGSATAQATLGGVAMPTTPAGVPSAFPTAGVGSSPVPIGAAATTGAAAAGAVSAGKYVADGVYVGVTQGLDASSSSVDVQIDVTKHISVDTTASQSAGTGLGVNWKLDY